MQLPTVARKAAGNLGKNFCRVRRKAIEMKPKTTVAIFAAPILEIKSMNILKSPLLIILYPKILSIWLMIIVNIRPFK